ncbi:MAG: 23S rRNA (guanosine(2251)-2'-O)-methyltransferase RlmB [Verrucomicrobiota bacterium]
MSRNPRFFKQRSHQHTDLNLPAIRLGEEELYQKVSDAGKDAFVLILDGVQDPHNLGACLRSADAAGVQALVIPKNKAVGLTETARKVACGGAENTPVVQVTNLARCLDQLKKAGLWLVGTDDQGEKDLHDVDLTGPIGLVMGSEGKGLRRLTREHCDFLTRIPMAEGCRVDCLNVSVATGVTLFETLRQRRAGAGKKG